MNSFNIFARLTKLSFVGKTPDGEWGVFSHKGKLLGKYKTKQEANKRLRQIEFFKHKKASSNETYSSLMRDIAKRDGAEMLRAFRKAFKEAFDKALIEEVSNPEDVALEAAKKILSGSND